MSGEKTEQPTPKRLRDARQKGQVAKSQEVPSAMVVLAVVGAIWAGWDILLETLRSLILRPVSLFDLPFQQSFGILFKSAVYDFLYLTMPVVILAGVAGAAGHILQIGFMFVIEPAKPSLDKLNPKQWFKKVFCMKNVMEFLKSSLKVLVISLVLWKVIKDSTPTLVLMPYGDVQRSVSCLGAVSFEMMKYCGVTFVAIAVGDYFLQRYFHMKENRMTKDEVKREYKEMEGDPQIKGQRKQLHREMAMNDIIADTRKSDVLVTNPTHLAIALRYRKGETPLPLISARGEGALAKRMLEVAQEEGIPIMRNVPLAHDLWEQGTVAEYIPSELIEPVAEVLRWVQEVTGNR